MIDLSILDTTFASISATPKQLEVLRDLHTQALTEAPYLSTDENPESAALTKFVALDPDKCAIVYLLLKASGARNVVEAGTSFGLSTIYLALGVSDNGGKVIATENEPTKAARAKEHWKRADVDGLIELREGDLRETLKTDLPHIDFLLLDIWTPLALPALKLVQPHLRKGALVVADNVTAAQEGYKDLQAYLNDASNGFKSTIAPYEGGLQISVYLGQ